MHLLFCADPFDIRRPDPAFMNEVAAAEQAGLSYSLIDFGAFVDEQNTMKALRRIAPVSEQRFAVYRGWMLKPSAYQHLYDALTERGLMLINTPTAYRHCHYLPASYPIIEAHTPRTTWLHVVPGESVAMGDVMAALRPFGEKPVIMKDFVKSRKHEWDEACFIPSAADRAAVERVTLRFLELQGDDLNEGLVFREFVEFEPLGMHSRSGMPLTKEYRLFFLDGNMICSSACWEEGDYGDIQLPIGFFSEIAQRVQSRFFTMDVARRLNGDWLIIELGDGQVAGLPALADAAAFYRVL